MNWIGLILTGLLAAQDPFTLKLDVEVVSVDVTVLDSKDNLVNNLTKDDFLIYEDRVPQPIRFFSPVSAPSHIFLLFDTSDSTVGNRNFMVNSANKLIENLKPQDSIALGSFDDRFQLDLPWTTERARASKALKYMLRPRESNGTRFYSALDRTLRREFKGVTGRRAVVVLTDGQDTPFFYESRGDFKKALESTRQQRIPVYIVALKSDAASRAVFQNTLVYLQTMQFNMQRFADNSGGEMLFPKDLDDVERLYEQLGQRLGSSYSLGYVPSSGKRDGKPHRIEVKTRAGGHRITQSRTSYHVLPPR